MGNKISYKKLASDIANSYRNVTNTTEQIMVSELSNKIESLSQTKNKIYFGEAGPNHADGENGDWYICLTDAEPTGE